eukprot:8651340-Pyramimonas_sp.AAC.1
MRRSSVSTWCCSSATWFVNVWHSPLSGLNPGHCASTRPSQARLLNKPPGDMRRRAASFVRSLSTPSHRGCMRDEKPCMLARRSSVRRAAYCERDWLDRSRALLLLVG